MDPRGPPANFATHGVNCRLLIILTNIRQNIMSYLFMKLSFIHLIRFRGDDARVFQPLVKPHARYQARSQWGAMGEIAPPPQF